MAEIAAGVWAAEEVVSTAIQGGAAAYAVAKPTMPLKATFNQIATANDDRTRLSLARSHHTLTVVGNKAYIFGGSTASAQLASTDIHAVTLGGAQRNHEPDYAVIPAVPASSGYPTPPPRTRHAACKLNVCIAVFGGCDEAGAVIDEDATLWLYNTAKTGWESLRASDADISPVARANAKLFEFENNLVLYGGMDAHGQPLKDVWHFSYVARSWKPLASAPVSTSNAALVDGALYLITASEALSGDVHSLDLRDANAQWATTAFPTNPFTPGPRSRLGGGLLPVLTGYGRNYLLYFFGARQDPSTHRTAAPETTHDPTQWSDIWTLQLPSSRPELKATTSISDALKPAAIKDAIRAKLGYDSGEQSWSEVEVMPPGDLGAMPEGKVHPGPRADFGCDVMGDGVSMVFWGGVNAKGEKEADGWIIRLA